MKPPAPPTDDALSCRPIGVVRSCFKQKFGIPRQSGLASEARATLEFHPPFDRAEAFEGLDAFSHIWLLFWFHHNPPARPWKPTVRPPRLGGNTRRGVFATRSPFRPNPIGLSVVELTAVERRGGRVRLHLKGVDLLDGTPVLDVKPYLPYVDRVEQARGGFASAPPTTSLPVEFTPAAQARLRQLEQHHPGLETLIRQLLASDPRPAYRQGEDSSHQGMRLYDFDLRWQVCDGRILVTELADYRAQKDR